MKRALKWIGIAVLVLAVVGFLGFLYFIPPFTLMKPEEFSGPTGKAGPDLSKIADPGERAIAEHGHYLVTISACSDCHSTPGPQGPRIADMYLAGGFKMARRNHGTHISYNLTSDKSTGLGNWSDDDIKRVLRTGLAPDGRAIPGHLMPWPSFSNYTDEDLHAIIVYLRHTVPVVHQIPNPTGDAFTDTRAMEEDYGGADYAAPAGGSK